MSPAITRAGLSRGYQVISDETRNAGNPSPAEIVARLHEQIAAKSPEHAALVARWEKKQAAARPGIHPRRAAELAPAVRRAKPDTAAAVPGNPRPVLPPHARDGGLSSPQPSERQATGIPSPVTGMAGPAVLPAVPARGRAETPSPGSSAVAAEGETAEARGRTPALAGGVPDTSALSAGQQAIAAAMTGHPS